jgi:hypothetical protein
MRQRRSVFKRHNGFEVASLPKIPPDTPQDQILRLYKVRI